jgi:hypothetical protein
MRPRLKCRKSDVKAALKKAFQTAISDSSAKGVLAQGWRGFFSGATDVAQTPQRLKHLPPQSRKCLRVSPNFGEI